MGSYALAGKYYDYLYPTKDYAGEVAGLLEFLQGHGLPPSAEALDLACGTGRHLEFLCRHFKCEGLDLEPALLEIAKSRLPDVSLHQVNMLDFDLGESRHAN